MENEKKLILLASEVSISEQDKLDPVFLKVRFKLADNVGNQNNEGMTGAFIKDLIERQDQFECLPVYVDMNRLLAGDYDNLTHMYSKLTKKFKTQQFGSLTNFYAETGADGVISLCAEARFPKRELEACMGLVTMYELGKLCVSVELRYNPEFTVYKNGVMFIDANEDNALTGIAIVSDPACRDAVAFDMVAEKNADDSVIDTQDEESEDRGETNQMKDNEEKMTAETEEVKEEVAVAEEAQSEQEPVPAEAEMTAETQDMEEPEKQEEPEGEPEDAQDPEEKKDEQAVAEVLEHSVDIHEGIYECPESGETIHVVETTERYVETIEEQNRVIAELKNQIAELEEVKSKYDAIIAEREAAELAQKKEQARAFAEKQGLDVTVAEVNEAIDHLDYTKIAMLSMAQTQEENEQEKVQEQPQISLASFIELEVGEDAYGGLLKPRSRK